MLSSFGLFSSSSLEIALWIEVFATNAKEGNKEANEKDSKDDGKDEPKKWVVKVGRYLRFELGIESFDGVVVRGDVIGELEHGG